MNNTKSESAEAREFLAGIIEEKAALKKVAEESITEAAGDWMGARYLLAARDRLAESSGEERWEVLRTMIQDVAGLRRGEYWSARMGLARERFEWSKVNCKLEKEREFQEWLKRPAVRAKILPKDKGGLTKKTIREVEKALNLM